MIEADVDTIINLQKEEDIQRMAQIDPNYMRDITLEGTGAEVKAGDTISAHYTGKLQSNGQKFDSSHDRNKPLDFKVGAG